MNLKKLFKHNNNNLATIEECSNISIKTEVGEIIKKQQDSKQNSTISSPESTIAEDGFFCEISNEYNNDSASSIEEDTVPELKSRPEPLQLNNQDSFIFDNPDKKFMPIGIKLVKTPNEEKFPNSINKTNRNSHRFSSIHPSYKIKRVPMETMEILTSTFHEYVEDNDLEYKSLDPQSEAVYILHRQSMYNNKKFEIKVNKGMEPLAISELEKIN